MANDKTMIRGNTTEKDRISAIVCQSPMDSDLSYMADSIKALGLPVEKVNPASLKELTGRSDAKIIAFNLGSNPDEVIEAAKSLTGTLITATHFMFFAAGPLSLEHRIQIAEFEDGFLYDQETSFIKISNDIKYHLSSSNQVGLNVILVDDSMTESFVTKKLLEKAGYNVSAFHSPSEAYEYLTTNIPDIVVVDLHMPEMNGDTFVRLLRQNPKYLSLPVVFLSNEIDSNLKIKAVSHGADDFLSKPVNKFFPSYLANRIVRAREQKEQMDRDSLTGLLNHSTILSEIEYMITTEAVDNAAVIMLDIDHFKAVNDTHGHPVGDQVLRAISILLSRSLREGDLIGRFGGEEFLVALPNTSPANANMIMNRILQSFKNIAFENEQGVKFNCAFSAGISQLSEIGGADTALSQADKALYEAKRQGRSQVKRAANG